MVRKLVIGLTAAIAVAAGLVSSHARGDSVIAARPTGPTGCLVLPAFARGDATGLATGRGLWAAAGGADLDSRRRRTDPCRAGSQGTR